MALLINKDSDVSVEQILPIYTVILSKLLEVDETQDDDNSVDDGGDTGDEPREYLERKDLLHGKVKGRGCHSVFWKNKTTATKNRQINKP